jgi:glycosyltransferase involved in cell wall biosynthesis
MILSIAMMVKNEAAHLERCLKSLCQLIPHIQIIILDTGSTDNTVEIARKYTNLIYHQKWQDNFALHRNKSFSYCTGDWIMQIDADEELCFTSCKPEGLIEFLKNVPKEINAIGLPMKDWRKSQKEYVAELDLIRIFRAGQVTWKRRIHNEAVFRPNRLFSISLFKALRLRS